ncbi:amidohydrolase [Geofilum rubicundum]|uniref:Omega-amidase YafV n=1 Tax=Geofilum rubicundum JCM 15548 TaxID=1236989 RepID=A0A0E9LZM9_9BACT|nr:amidohydrolase [Geofilum rubicundum]GAO30330.1 aliphatic amidase AmiE [Geofilum rubicundum JCM 15548]
MLDELKLSLVQFDIAWEDMEVNFHKVSEMLENDHFNSGLIILPEMFNSGFTMRPERIASDETNRRVINWMKEMAHKHEATILGSMAYHEEGRYYNRFLAVEPNGHLTSYNKRHLFRMTGEQNVYEKGEDRVIIQVGKWRVALFVCYDLRFPVWSRNLKEYDMAVYVANWPHKRREVWQTLLKARAIENQCYVVGVNRVGKSPSEYYSGQTMLIDYQGAVLNEAADNIEVVVTGMVNLNDLEAFRTTFPAWMDADQFNFLP